MAITIILSLALAATNALGMTLLFLMSKKRK